MVNSWHSLLSFTLVNSSHVSRAVSHGAFISSGLSKPTMLLCHRRDLQCYIGIACRCLSSKVKGLSNVHCCFVSRRPSLAVTSLSPTNDQGNLS
ncbi:hypothetical protein BDV19DRAFT_31311 [Aspergillus venezuelensis]